MDTCDTTIRFGDDTLTCDLPANHTTPSPELPQGSPHQDGTSLDSLTSKPRKWWG